MQIDALGYVGIHSDDLEDWATYAHPLSRHAARRQEPQHARAAHGRPQAARDRQRRRRRRRSFYGWEVADAAALEALAAHLEESGVKSRAAHARSPTSAASRT